MHGAVKNQKVVNGQQREIDAYDTQMLEQFYKRDENVILYQMYEILCACESRQMNYSEICKRYNEKYANSKKRCA
jgi:hypothetical protein